MEYIAFNEVGVTIACLAGAFTFVVITWNCIKAIKELIAALREPTNERIDETAEQVADHEQRISHLEECCSEVRGKLQSDWEWQQASSEKDELMLRSIKHILKHSIDGNDTQGLKKMEAEIDDYLIRHQQH